MRGLYRKRAARAEERLRAKRVGRSPRISARRERELVIEQGQPSLGSCASGLPVSMGRILQVGVGGDVVILESRTRPLGNASPTAG